MAENVAEDFDLAQLAAQVGLSKFHFHRLFKSAVGVGIGVISNNPVLSQALGNATDGEP